MLTYGDLDAMKDSGNLNGNDKVRITPMGLFQDNTKRPKHWTAMEAAIGRKLLVGDIFYGHPDELNESSKSFRRSVVARPSEGRVLLISTSMAPGDEAPSEAEETFITNGDDLETREIGKKWSWRHRRVAMRAVAAAVDGAIQHPWLTIWDDRFLHIVARVKRPGLHDSLQTIIATRPEGSIFRETSEAQVRSFRPLPKLFVESGFVTTYGRTEEKKKPGKDLQIEQAW